MRVFVISEALIHEADKLACWSWNERMWSDGGPADPSPTYVISPAHGGLFVLADT